MPPGSFNDILNSKIKNLYTESDFVTMGNMKDLLHMRDVGNNIFSVFEINNLLDVLCTD